MTSTGGPYIQSTGTYAGGTTTASAGGGGGSSGGSSGGVGTFSTIYVSNTASVKTLLLNNGVVSGDFEVDGNLTLKGLVNAAGENGIFKDITARYYGANNFDPRYPLDFGEVTTVNSTAAASPPSSTIDFVDLPLVVYKKEAADTQVSCTSLSRFGGSYYTANHAGSKGHIFYTGSRVANSTEMGANPNVVVVGALAMTVIDTGVTVSVPLVATSTVTGTLGVAGSVASGFVFDCNGAAALRGSLQCFGNVGIGKVPTIPLDVVGNGSLTGTFTVGSVSSGQSSVSALMIKGGSAPSSGTAQGFYGLWNNLNSGVGATEFVNNRGGGGGGFYFYTNTVGGTPTQLLRIASDGTGQFAGNLSAGNQVSGASATFTNAVNAANANITNTVTSATVTTTTLGASGVATLNSANVTNNATVGGTLGVTGASTLSSLAVTNNATVGGTLNVTGASTMSTLSSGSVTATSGGVSTTTLNATGQINGTGGLQIVGNSALSTVSTSDLTSTTHTATSLYVKAGTVLNNASSAGSYQSFNNITAGQNYTEFVNNRGGGAPVGGFRFYTNTIAGTPTLLFTINSDGSGTFAGGVSTAAGNFTTLTVTGNSTLAGTTATTLSTSGAATFSSATITNNAAVGGTLAVTGTSTFAGANATTLTTSGAATLNSAAVTTNATVGGTLAVTGTSTLAGASATTLSTSGAATLNSATVTNNATVGGTLAVAGTSTLAATNATTLTSSGVATLNSAAVTNNATVGGTLGVTGTTTLAGATATTLSTSGAATLNSASVTTNATVGGTLAVTGTSTLAATNATTLTSSGAATLNSAAVTNNATVGGTLTVTGASTLATTSVTNLTVSGTTAFGTVGFGDGTAASPSIQFAADTDTGIFRNANNQMGLTTNGSTKMFLDQFYVTAQVPILIPNGSGTGCALSWFADTTTGLYRVSQGTIGIGCSGTKTVQIDNTGVGITGNLGVSASSTFGGRMGMSDGTQAAPALNFSSEGNTGIWKGNVNNLSITVAGVNQMAITNTQTILAGNLLANGTNRQGNNSTLWSQTSDRRLKKNIVPHADGLAVIEKLQPVAFQYNGRNPYCPDDGVTHIGLIAQDASPVIPRCLQSSTDTLDGVQTELFSMDYSEMIFTLMNAVKELSSQNKSLTARVASLESARLTVRL